MGRANFCSFKHALTFVQTALRFAYLRYQVLNARSCFFAPRLHLLVGGKPDILLFHLNVGESRVGLSYAGLNGQFLACEFRIPIYRKSPPCHHIGNSPPFGRKTRQLLGCLDANEFLKVQFARERFGMLAVGFDFLLQVFVLLGQALLMGEDQFVEGGEGN